MSSEIVSTIFPHNIPDFDCRVRTTGGKKCGGGIKGHIRNWSYVNCLWKKKKILLVLT